MMQNNTHYNFHNPNQQIEMGEEGENFKMTNYDNWEQEEARPLNESNHNDQPMFKRPSVPNSEDSQTNEKENENMHKRRIKSISSIQDGNGCAYSPRETSNTVNEMFPSLYPSAPLSKIIEQKVAPKKESSSSTNFNNFQMGSNHLKENLSKKGR